MIFFGGVRRQLVRSASLLIYTVWTAVCVNIVNISITWFISTIVEVRFCVDGTPRLRTESQRQLLEFHCSWPHDIITSLSVFAAT